MDTNHARYKIGLSGTIERKDGKHVVFRDYFSQKVFKPPKENFMTPKVDIIKSEIRFMDGARTPWANRVTNLATNEEYVHTVAMLASYYAARGHKVLVVSDRVNFLKNCAILAGEKAICVTGDVPHEERETLLNEINYGDKNILFGTKRYLVKAYQSMPLAVLFLLPLSITKLLSRSLSEELFESKKKT